MITAEHKRIRPLVMLYPWISRCWVKEEKVRKAEATRNAKAKAKAKASKAKATKTKRTDEDKKGKGEGKGKANAKAITKHFLGYCLVCKAWRHAMKDCWWNENAESAKDTASLETPTTPAESTKTEPPITGMLIQPDEGGEIPAGDTQWMYAVTKQEAVPNINGFLIDAGAATSVCQQSLADSLGGRPRGPVVELRSATGQHDNLLACTRRCQRGE